MSPYRLSSSLPSAWFARAAAFFKVAYAVIISRGIRSCPMLKCSSERWVCAPQSLSAGTSTLPRLSDSTRMSVTVLLRIDRTVGARANQPLDVLRPRDSRQPFVENMCCDPLRDMKGHVENVAVGRIDWPSSPVPLRSSLGPGLGGG